MLPAVNPTKTEAWGELKALYKATKNDTMREAFQKDPMRAQKYSLIWNEILLDYSKNRINDQIIDALFRLAEQTGVFEAIEMMFEGSAINATENRPVLHTALRRPETDKLLVKGRDIMPDIHSVLKRMRTFAHNVRHGVHTGYTGKPIRHVVNIGIGGSDLGPKMVVEALKPYQKEGLSIYFVSNVDPSHIYEVFKVIDPETTLFLIASKTFTTQETMLNAHAAKDWHIRHAREHQRIDLHFAAMSTNLKGVEAFGINTKNCFEFWDFVGGRFSLWSAIGLPIMMSVGTRLFDELLEGAHAMDRHFATEKRENIPLMMALLGIWYQNFYGADTHAVLPYLQYLNEFPAYLQQADMESNGKYVDRNGKVVEYQTGPIIFGEPGTNGQHAFYQLLHQGKKLIPADFIATVNPRVDLNDQNKVLYANFVAQTEALMRGKNLEEVKQEGFNLPKEILRNLEPFKVFEGNRPTNSILVKKLTPFNLGALIAAYEHKIFVQGIVWNIYSFDQWGVELGKVLARKVLGELNATEKRETDHDASTAQLIDIYKKWKE